MRRGTICRLLFRRFSVLSFLKSVYAYVIHAMYQGARLLLQTELAYIDALANLKIRLDSVKRMTQIQNTS